MRTAKEACDTLIEARWCLPVADGDAVLENHSIAVNDGRIVAILPSDDARERFAAGAVVSRPGHAVLPGLVNAHSHAAMTLLRGYAEDLPLGQWLRDGIWPAERRWVGAEMVRDGTRHAIAEMLKAGITCFSDQYFFPEVVAEVAAELQIRAVIATPVIDFETAWARDGSDCLQKAADLVHDAYADHPLITTAFAPHSTEVISDETFRALRVMADQLDLPVQIHLHESTTEIAAEKAKSGMRPLERLRHLGLVNASLLAVHCVHLESDEIGLMADAGVGVAHCPRSNLKLASGIAPLVQLLEAGIRVGLGTDSAASNNELDMLGELRSAALLAKAASANAAAVPAAAALRLATRDAAAALGLEPVVGSLESGKQADIVCLDFDRLNSQPLHDPVSQVVYTARADQVTDVWVSGRHLVDDGSLAGVDEREIVARSQEWRERMVAAR